MKKVVVYGFYGAVLDYAWKKSKRWNKWRPTLSLCRHDDLVVHRMELLVQKQYLSSAEVLVEDIHNVSPETEVVVRIIELENPWDFQEVFSCLHDFTKTIDFKDNEDNLIHITTGTHVAQICLFLLTEANYFPGRLVQTSPPPKDDSTSPGSYTIIDLDLSKYDLIASRFEKETVEGRSFLKSGIATRNLKFNDLIEQIEQVAIGSKFPMLLMGPTGAGKTQLAKRIYELKKLRRQVEGQFVEVNCATLRGEGAMSALFGHVRGSFTGASHDRPGLLRTANKGLLFLDEVGELGLDEQAMLLRALEHGTFMPVGSDREVHSEFQLIAGTNRNLAESVSKGRFREDLLARINLWTFFLPGLKDRLEDLEPNLNYELEVFTRRAGRSVTFNKEARSRYLKFATGPDALWRANFRDLNASMSRMGTLALGGRINEDIVKEEIERLRGQWSSGNSPFKILEDYLSHEQIEAIDLFDRPQLATVLATVKSSRNLADAGRKLFQASRLQKKSSNDSDRLSKYLARFGLVAGDVLR